MECKNKREREFEMLARKVSPGRKPGKKVSISRIRCSAHESCSAMLSADNILDDSNHRHSSDETKNSNDFRGCPSIFLSIVKLGQRNEARRKPFLTITLDTQLLLVIILVDRCVDRVVGGEKEVVERVVDEDGKWWRYFL